MKCLEMVRRALDKVFFTKSNVWNLKDAVYETLWALIKDDKVSFTGNFETVSEAFVVILDGLNEIQDLLNSILACIEEKEEERRNEGGGGVNA